MYTTPARYPALRNIGWWLVYAMAAVWAQSFVPGVDFLLPGLILTLQEQRPVQTLWVVVCFALIQEGCSTLSFGSVVGQYLVTILLFQGGRWLFEARNLPFVLLLSGLFGLVHYGMTVTMLMLQDMPVRQTPLLYESLWQALLIPVCWLPLRPLRSRFVPHEDAS